MPTITLQVGQCGNQLGQSLWEQLNAQLSTGSYIPEDVEFFKVNQQGKKQARCLLVDTEPKVVNSILNQDAAGIFSKRRCFVGQSGRGNNWAFGYSQLLPTSVHDRPAAHAGWNSCALVEDPAMVEYNILEQVVEGIRLESEECDGAPNFLMLHSLGGGSGSGLGSRILEHLREEYPLNYIATASVAPTAAGDSPMQALNTVMAMSFLQAYSDMVMVFNNQDLLDGASKGLIKASGSGATLADINNYIAACVSGALWPLDLDDALCGQSRVRDLVNTVTPDNCMKLVETRTIYPHANTPAQTIWQESCKALARAFPKYDAMDSDRIVTSSAMMLVDRGFPTHDTSMPSPARPTGNSSLPGVLDSSSAAHQSAMKAYLQAAGGASTFSSPADAAACVHIRHSPARLYTLGGGNASGSSKGNGSATASATQDSGRGSKAMSLTGIANRSSVIGLLGRTVHQARTILDAGAYLHWYSKYGCSQDAIQAAIQQVSDVVDCYRASHDVSDSA